jgi:hypothetical protein
MMMTPTFVNFTAKTKGFVKHWCNVTGIEVLTN